MSVSYHDFLNSKLHEGADHMTTIVVYLPIAVEVDFDYQPAEPADTGPEARYPGCAESAEINAVRVGDLDITEQLDHYDFASLETIILEARE